MSPLLFVSKVFVEPSTPLRSMVVTFVEALRSPLFAVRSTFEARSTSLKFWIVSVEAAVMLPLMSRVSPFAKLPLNVAAPSASTPFVVSVSTPVASSLSSTVKLCVPVPSVTFESVMAP